MAAEKTNSKKSSRSTKGATKRTRLPRESRIAKRRSEQTAKTSESTPAVKSLDADLSLAERVESERERIFKAVSIVLCCWYATVTKWAVDDNEYMIPAFEAVCDLLNDAAEELEAVASACKKIASTGRH